MTEAPPQHHAPPRQPLFNSMPAVVVALAGAIVAVTAVQLLGPPRTANAMAAAAALLKGAAFPGFEQTFGPLPPLALHVFLHGGWLHLLMNMAALAAFGPPVALALGRGPRGAGLFLLFFFLCAVGGGLAQLAAFRIEGGGLAIGASSALSGFLPAVGWLQRRWRGAVAMAGPWIVINLLLAVSGAAFPLPIAWAAHLGGLAAGILLFPLVLALRGRPPAGPWSAPLR